MWDKAKKTREWIVDLIKLNQIFLMTLLYALVIVDALLLKAKSDLIIFSLIGIYVCFIKVYKLKSRSAFIFCLVLLLLMYIYFLLTGPGLHTEKTAVWLILFMIVGIIQQWREKAS